MSCVICKRDLTVKPTILVKQKGLQKLLECSLKRKDNLGEAFRNVDSITLHSTCRFRYCGGKINNQGELVPYKLDSLYESPVHTSPNEDYEAFTNYLLTEGNSHYDPIKDKIDLNTSKTKDNVQTPSNVPVCFEPESSQLSVKRVRKSTSGRFLQRETSNIEIDPSKPFPFEHLCFICAKDISSKFVQNEKKKHVKARNMVVKVMHQRTKETVLGHLSKKLEQENQTIVQRIQNIDLVQANARYHSKCMRRVYLRTSQNNPGLRRGRPKCSKAIAAMQTVYKYIDESSKTNFTMRELANLDENLPCKKTIKNNIEYRYRGNVYFSSLQGYSTVITIIKDANKDLIQNENDYLTWKHLNFTHITIQSYLLFFLHSIIAKFSSKIPVEFTNYSREKFQKKTKIKKDNIEEQQSNEENATEEKRKSSRLTDIEKKREESVVANTHLNIENEKEKRSERIAKKKKESKQTWEVKDERSSIEDDVEMLLDDSPSSPGEDDNDCEQNASFNEDDYKNKLFCRVCLTSDRKLDVLGEYYDIYLKICADIVLDDTKLFLVCWECRALLVHARRFRERVETAHRLLMSEVKPESLSTISMTTPNVLVTSCDCEIQNIKTEDEYSCEQTNETNQNDNLNLSVNEKSNKSNENEDSNQVIEIQYSPQTVEGEGNIEDITTFDDGWSDEETELSSEPKRPRGSAVNKAQGAKEKDDDVSDELENSEDSEDPDWEKDQSTRMKSKKDHTKRLPLRFRIEVEDYDVDSKIRREPIAEDELDHWLESERNSVYFKLSKRRRCRRCITEIPDGEHHENIYHSKSNPLVCNICKFTCSSEAVLSSHVAGHYWVLCCSLCSYRCYNRLHMRSHVTWHMKTVRCLDCQGAFNSIDTFQQHYEEIHMRATCDHCGKHFPHKLYLENHIQKKHAPLVCTICNLTYRRYSSLRFHMNLKHRVERTEAAYCVQCDKQFDNEKLLKRHVYTNIVHASEWRRAYRKQKPEKAESHKCPDCPKQYHSAWYLKQHYRLVHENTIQFYCDQCKKGYANKGALRRHIMRVHEGYVYPKNQFCHMCGQGFTRKRILINHIRTHTGERPFACPHPQCDAKFAQKTAMTSHVKHVHENTPRQQAATSSGHTYHLDDIPF